MKNYKDGTVLTVYKNSDLSHTPINAAVETHNGVRGVKVGLTIWYENYFLENYTIISEVKPKLYTVDDLERAFESGKITYLSNLPIYKNFEEYLKTL